MLNPVCVYSVVAYRAVIATAIHICLLTVGPNVEPLTCILMLLLWQI